MLEGDAPSGVTSNAEASGTDLAGYLTEGPGFSTFAKDDGVVYHTYLDASAGPEFLMGYYPILDRAPRGATRARTGAPAPPPDEYQLERGYAPAARAVSPMIRQLGGLDHIGQWLVGRSTR